MSWKPPRTSFGPLCCSAKVPTALVPPGAKHATRVDVSTCGLLHLVLVKLGQFHALWLRGADSAGFPVKGSGVGCLSMLMSCHFNCAAPISTHSRSSLASRKH